MIAEHNEYDDAMSAITPCLWFDGNADAAVDHYLAIFPNSRRTVSPGSDEEPGAALVVPFVLDGRPFMAVNGGPAFQFTPAVSFVIPCETQDEVDWYWNRLLDGGTPSQCGWLTDRFGVSWQVVPNRLAELMRSPSRQCRERVLAAMLGMVKLDIAGLEEAAAGP